MIADLPHALRDSPRFLARLNSRRAYHRLRPRGPRRQPGSGFRGAAEECDPRHVANTADPAQATRPTAAEFVLESIGEVQRFLNTLAPPVGA